MSGLFVSPMERSYRLIATLSFLYFSNCYQSLKGACIRFLFNNMPKWLWLIVVKKMVLSRPQASFLPHVEDKGTVPPAPQLSYIKTRAILEELAAARAAPTPV